MSNGDVIIEDKITEEVRKVQESVVAIIEGSQSDANTVVNERTNENDVADSSEKQENPTEKVEDVEFSDISINQFKTPVIVFPFKIYALGNMDGLADDEVGRFCSKGYIFPVGYKAEKKYYGINNILEKEFYTSNIVNKNGSPYFLVKDSNDVVVGEGKSTSRAWMDLIARINTKRKKEKIGQIGKVTGGPMQFGFTNPEIGSLIEKYCDRRKRCEKFYLSVAGGTPRRKKKSIRSHGSARSIKSNDSERSDPTYSLPIKIATYKVGDVVEGKFQNGIYWYPGKIAVVLGRNKYDVHYDDDDYERGVPSAFIREKQQKDYVEDMIIDPAAAARAKQTYSLGDEVEALWEKGSEWYMGKISAVTEQPTGENLYSVSYDDGDFEKNVSPSLIRKRKSKPVKVFREEEAEPKEVEEPVKEKEKIKSPKKEKRRRSSNANTSPIVAATPSKKMKLMADPIQVGQALLLSTIMKMAAAALDMNQKKICVDLESKQVATATHKHSLDEDVQKSVIELVAKIFPTWEVDFDAEGSKMEISFGG